MHICIILEPLVPTSSVISRLRVVLLVEFIFNANFFIARSRLRTEGQGIPNVAY